MIEKRGKYDKSGSNNPFYGKAHTDETKKIISIKNTGRSSGNKNSHWKGGPKTLICLNCKQQFERSVADAENGYNKFCCKECYFEYRKNRSMTPAQRILNHKMRHTVGRFLKNKNETIKWPNSLGYTIDDMKIHIESKFQHGMTWENHGKVWHIDHIIPVSWFNFKDMKSRALKECWSLLNLQPLFFEENLSKNGGDRLKKKVTFIAIDNGITGSVAILKMSGLIEHFKMCIKHEEDYTKDANFIHRIDYAELKNRLKQYAIKDETNYPIAIIERPLKNPMLFRASISAVRALEAVLIVLENLHISYVFIDSREWQKLLLPGIVGKDELKKASNILCEKLFPNITLKNDGDGDSILIAEYCKRKYSHEMLNEEINNI